MGISPTFGDRVVLTVAGAPELLVGDTGEVVGSSDDGQYVGVWITRLQKVYTVGVDQVEVQD